MEGMAEARRGMTLMCRKKARKITGKNSICWEEKAHGKNHGYINMLNISSFMQFMALWFFWEKLIIIYKLSCCINRSVLNKKSDFVAYFVVSFLCIFLFHFDFNDKILLHYQLLSSQNF